MVTFNFTIRSRIFTGANRIILLELDPLIVITPIYTTSVFALSNDVKSQCYWDPAKQVKID